MGLYKCKLCGGDIEFEPGAKVGVCGCCGSRVKLEPSDNESAGAAAKSKEQKSNDARKKSAGKKRKKRLTRVAELALVGVIAGITLFVILKQKPAEDKDLYTFDPDHNYIGKNFSLGHYDSENWWIVLDQVDDKVLLLSKYAICYKAFNDEENDVTWSTCSLRNWLNTEFLTQAFSDEERERIVDTPVHTEDNQQYGTLGGDDTVDKVFLLSLEEVNNYIPEERGRYMFPDEGMSAFWWLRSPGGSPRHAATVGHYGSISNYGCYICSDDNAVRPALWIKLTP